MNSHEREELLSAYLDDELSAEDRARVEQWLVDDADYRRLHEELLSLRSDLQALPRHKLRDDLGPAILRRVEQQSKQGSNSPPTATTVELAPRSAVAEWWSRRSGRTFFWPVVAVAAALVVALFNTQVDERDIALEDTALKREAGEAASPKSASAPFDTRLASERADENVADQMPAAAAVPRDRAAPELKVANDAEAAPAFEYRKGAGNAGAMKAAAPVTANAPTPASQEELYELGAKLETDLQQAIKNRDQVNLIQCDVSPAFLNENPLEKVLVGNKITYQRYAIPQTDLKQNRAIHAQSELLADDDLGYAVQATPEQVETIVNELKEEQDRRRVSNLAVGLQQAPADAESQSAAKPSPQQRILLNAKGVQQPITIYLRKQGAPQQAPATAPAEAPQP